LLGLFLWMGRAMTQKAFLICNARVWHSPLADAVLVADGRVARIGRGAELSGGAVEEIDAGGGAVLPGFVDSHTHLLHSGLAESGWQVELSGCGRAEALERIAARARERTVEEWIVARGWGESCWSPAELLSRAELDRAAPHVPVVAIRVDGHVAVLNGPAVLQARLAVRGRAASADLANGQAREGAIECLEALARPSQSAVADALQAAARVCHREGITTAGTFSGWLDPGVFVAAARGLRLRLVVHPPIERLPQLEALGLRTGDGDEWARWGGVKLFADGSVGARNAAVSQPYLPRGRGVLLYRSGALRRLLAAADGAGWQTLVHAIGDRAIGQVVRAHREARTTAELRHRIEHFEFPTAAQVEATRDLGLCLSMQPNFVGNWSGSGGLYERALGASRDSECNPFRAVLEAGIPLGLGSDGMPLSPLYGVSSAVGAPHAGQRMTIEECVASYTAGSAFLSGDAPSAGRLAIGEPADLVLLNGPLDENGLSRLAVSRTWVAGECVFAAKEER